MIKKGIILAGGMGTRMSPLTKAVNKQLLPLYDKPLIYYPLSVLMLAGIKNILIIVNRGQLNQFKKILPEKNNFGVNLQYKEQAKPRGLPDAFILGEKFIGKDNVALILGDNFFYGQSLTKSLNKNSKFKSGAKIYLHQVKNPQLYGVAVLKKNKVIKVVEKPKKNLSNLAITGLYFFDKNVVSLSKKLKISKRKELEITDLLNKYKNKNKLKFDFIGRGGTWLDTGNIQDYYNATNYISAIENRQGLKIACLEEIALKKGWIKRLDIIKAIKFYGNCEYSNYLKSLI